LKKKEKKNRIEVNLTIAHLLLSSASRHFGEQNCTNRWGRQPSHHHHHQQHEGTVLPIAANWIAGAGAAMEA
jgi:hypothetical protein